MPTTPAASHPASANLTTERVALVTGGAGFIGSHLVDLLLLAGWKVRVLDNLSTGNLANLPAQHGRLEFIAADIRNANAVQHACAGVDTVFHLAAQVSVLESIREPRVTREVNVEGTAGLFGAAAAAGVRRVVFSSSCAVYGDDPAQPKKEDMPVAPLSPYATSKLAGEQLASRYSRQDLSIISLRYFNVYGPRQNPDSDYAAVVPRFIARALRGQAPMIYGDGGQTRDFLYVGDVARANLSAAELAGAPAAPALFNIGTGQATSVVELWRRIAAVIPLAPPPVYAAALPGEIRDSRADTTCARSVLGFTATTTLPQGLLATANALRPAPVRP